MRRGKLQSVAILILAFFLSAIGTVAQERLVDISTTLPRAGEAALLDLDVQIQKGSLRVAAVGEPNVDILEQAALYMAEKGYNLEILECQDYESPNQMVINGEADANLYQHTAFLWRYNQEKGSRLAAVDSVYYEPMRIYPGRTAALEELGEGAVIGVPANLTAYAKSLFLLQQAGLIELTEDADLTAVWEDVTANPRGLKLVEYEETQLPELLEELDLAVFHPGYALAAGVNPDEFLLQEETTGMTAGLLSTVLVSRDQEPTPELKLLIEVLESPEMKQYIEEYYYGSIVMLEE